MPLGKVDFSGWLDYNQVINSMNSAIKEVKITWLKAVATRYRQEIQDQILTQGIHTTGTYEQSLKIKMDSNSSDPNISLVLEPTGVNAGRLDIYWKVLEGGAAPIPDVPVRSIARWASDKKGASFLVAGKITRAIKERGVEPHPILQRIFILNPPEFNPIGITSLGEQIAEQEASNILKSLEQVYLSSSIKTRRTFAKIPKGQPGGGRFTSIR
jgi:hypothetical protein